MHSDIQIFQLHWTSMLMLQKKWKRKSSKDWIATSKYNIGLHIQKENIQSVVCSFFCSEAGKDKAALLWGGLTLQIREVIISCIWICSCIYYYRPTSFTSYFTSFARKVTQSRAKIWSMGDDWNMENLIVLTPAWSSMKEPQKGSRQWSLLKLVTKQKNNCFKCTGFIGSLPNGVVLN